MQGQRGSRGDLIGDDVTVADRLTVAMRLVAPVAVARGVRARVTAGALLVCALTAGTMLFAVGPR